jgi:hypothetical protein
VAELQEQPKADWAGNTRAEVLALFPEVIETWRCPACGRKLDGQTIDIDERREKCTKRIHTHGAVKSKYQRADVIRPRAFTWMLDLLEDAGLHLDAEFVADLRESAGLPPLPAPTEETHQ